MSTAVTDIKRAWYSQLDDSRRRALSVLEGVTLNKLIYPEKDWTVKDILAHLTTWEVEVATSIQHFAHGKSYSILSFRSREAYNERMYIQYRDKPGSVVFSDWVAVRSGLKSAIRKVPVDYLNRLVVSPWEDLLPLDDLIESLIAHEAAHITAIHQATR